MDSKAILTAILITWFVTGLIVLAAYLLNLTFPHPPQLLIIFGLFAIPGYVAAVRAGNAGTLHGLLSGMLGMLGIVLAVKLAVGLRWMPPHAAFDKSSIMMVVLAGFWGGFGGMVADTARLIKAKRALKKAGKRY